MDKYTAFWLALLAVYWIGMAAGHFIAKRKYKQKPIPINMSEEVKRIIAFDEFVNKDLK
jgi:hypothetical protein